MRKIILGILLSVMLLSLAGLTGCGGSGDDTTAQIRATAEGFMNAMQEGDLAAMQEYADPALFEEGGDLYSFGTIGNFDEEFAKAVGMNPDALSESTKAEMQKFVDTLMQNLVTSYKIKDVAKKNGIGEVSVTTTYGFDPEGMQNIDMKEEIEELSQAYMKENMDKLMAIYQKDGEEAMTAKLIEDMVSSILSQYTEKVMATGEVTQDSVLVIENKDGKWVVTGENTVD